MLVLGVKITIIKIFAYFILDLFLFAFVPGLWNLVVFIHYYSSWGISYALLVAYRLYQSPRPAAQGQNLFQGALLFFKQKVWEFAGMTFEGTVPMLVSFAVALTIGSLTVLITKKLLGWALWRIFCAPFKEYFRLPKIKNPPRWWENSYKFYRWVRFAERM